MKMLSPEALRQLQADDPGLARQYEAQRVAELDRLYPKPEAAELLEHHGDLLTGASGWHTTMRKNRAARYLQDKLPAKWQKDLSDGRRVYTRLSHNEIMRVVSAQTRNPWKFRVPPRGATEAARDRAQKQTRWLNQLLPALERRAGTAVRRIVADNQVGDSLGVWFVYLTKSYDALDLERGADESDSEYLKRTEPLLQEAKLPFGVRALDPMSVLWDMDEDGVASVFVHEIKPKRNEYARLKREKTAEEYERFIGRPGAPGQPPFGDTSERPANSVECIHYFDRRWYCYWVDGQLVDGPEEHRMPGVPCILQEGMVTGSPNLSQRLQGITWGMVDMEVALNDLLTKEIDNAFTYGRPKAVIETPANADLMYDERDKSKPMVLDLSQPGVPQLNPGQQIRNAYQGFVPYPTEHVQQALLAQWQRSGLNPIAQGESPGSDTAGFTVNTLTGAAQNLYEVNLDNEARAGSALGDFIRLLIRDTIGLPVYLSVPMANNRKGGTEWLGLGPEDIDETPSELTIDPLSDVNRLALQQSLRQGNKEGYLPREIVQVRGYAADDPEAWDDELVIDIAVQSLDAMAIEEAKAAILAAQQPPPPPTILGPDGNPLPPSQPTGQGIGAAPAPLQPPSVGAELATASRVTPGPTRLQPQTAMAGQNRMAIPPEGAG